MYWLLLILIIPYLYLFLRIYGNLGKLKSFRSEKPSEVFISLIVACHNEEKNLPLLLQDMAKQDYNPEMFELVIVDDNSTDSTYNIAAACSQIRNLKVRKNPETGKKSAIRSGVEACSGELLITTDADCRPGKSWLRIMATFYSENNPDMIIGPVMLKGNKGFSLRFQELEFLSLQGVTAGTAVAGNPVMCNGANLAFKKEVFIRNSDRLHPEIVSGDDVFLLHSLKEDHESKIMWLESEDAVISTSVQETLISFLKQRARWISKAGHYTDRSTRLLAIVTFVTILLQISLIVAGIFKPVLFLAFLAVFVIKSVPDFLILNNTASRYGKSNLMVWFVPSQLLYPLYILSVSLLSFKMKSKWK